MGGDDCRDDVGRGCELSTMMKMVRGGKERVQMFDKLFFYPRLSLPPPPPHFHVGIRYQSLGRKRGRSVSAKKKTTSGKGYGISR